MEDERMNISEEITLGRMKASYEIGNIRGKHDAEKHARIEAFAAIRRAVALARQAEKWSGVSAYEGFVMAQGVRAAIRAAIGSEKQ